MKNLLMSIGIMFALYGVSFSQTTLPYSQDFEAGVFPPTNWQVAHGGIGSSDWELSSIGVGSESSDRSVLFNNIGAPVTFYALRCEPINLTNAIAPTVTFDVAYARFDNSHTDALSMWYTTNVDGETGWVKVEDATTTINVEYSGSSLDTAPNQTTFFTPANNQWETKIVDLSNYAGLSYVRFAFESIPDNDNGQNVIYIDNVQFYDSSPLSVSNKTLSEFKIFPNPATNSFKLLTSVKNISENAVSIYNILGQKTTNFKMSSTSDGYRIQTENIPSGVYFITVQTLSTISTKKLIIE